MRASKQRQTFWNERGQSMLEFALLAPLLLSMVLAVIEIGRFWGAKQGITNAAREGARVMLLPYGVGAKFASQDAVNQAAILTTKQFLNTTGLAHEEPAVKIEPVWFDAQGKRTQTDFGSRELARGDQAGMRITYEFDTPLKLLLGGVDGFMTIRQQVLLDHE
ncbi:MAG: pilus assembly protein [Acidobacteria bacterium]|nr:pilus assembly protein [Acidobacteriota bacterium]